jgi:carotenoid 1,2-hydratase
VGPPAPFDALSRSCASARGGYAWWYIEAHDQAEGRYGLTLIVFAGSVFSPHYAQRLHLGHGDSGLDHPAVHFALYEREPGKPSLSRQRLWVMNEYPKAALVSDESTIGVANTMLRYREEGLDVVIDEDSTRFFGKPGERVRARLRIDTPLHIGTSVKPFALGENAAGEAHYWQPIAPAATCEVELSCGDLRLRFSGHAYCDRNCGSGRLEDTFRRWSWAHGVTEARSPAALVLYQAERWDGSVLALAVRYPAQPSPATDGGAAIWRDDASGWGASAGGRTDYLWLRVPPRFVLGDYQAERIRKGRLEDAPFYARYSARLSAPSDGAVSAQAAAQQTYLGVGEYLDLERFRSRAVQRLLTYKTRVVADFAALRAAT